MSTRLAPLRWSRGKWKLARWILAQMNGQADVEQQLRRARSQQISLSRQAAAVDLLLLRGAARLVTVSDIAAAHLEEHLSAAAFTLQWEAELRSESAIRRNKPGWQFGVTADRGLELTVFDAASLVTLSTKECAALHRALGRVLRTDIGKRVAGRLPNPAKEAMHV